jgi:hypothetical protein
MPLDRKESKCYATTLQSAAMGIWGHDVECLWSVVLTTWSQAVFTQGKNKGASKNTYKCLKADLAKLRFELEKLGYNLEYWFAPEVTPKKHLYHAHGFFRTYGAVSEIMFNQDVHRLWGLIHDSPIVYFENIYSIEIAIKYKVKDATKNFINNAAGNMRVLKSRGWLPKGWKKACKTIWEWQNYHAFPKWVDETNMDEYLSYAIEPERYIYDCKGIALDMKRRWCQHEQIELEYPDHVIVIEDQDYFERAVNNIVDKQETA